MKKFLLSSAVIVSFFAYSLYYRLTGTSFHPSEAVGVGGPSTAPSPTSGLQPVSQYKDGSYTGDSVDAFYGFIQVRATISGGRMTNVEFIQFPNDRSTSREINAQADPMLAQEAIQTQSAQVDVISGATDSSLAFVQSLQSALTKAKN